MVRIIERQRPRHLLFFAIFGIVSFVLMTYYLSATIIHFTTPQQFPINSFERFPLTWLIFPAEVFSFLFGLYFVYNLFTDRYRPVTPARLRSAAKERVALLIPVYNEPKEIVDRTIAACSAVRWVGGTRIYLLDDSTNEVDKTHMSQLAKKYGCIIVRRTDRIGYKAGNINNAIRTAIDENFFVILDSDQAPHPEFLEETMHYFSDPTVGFVQTPQHFIEESTPIERAAKVGTNIFYHAMCVSKARDGAMPFCGTNAVIRTSAFKEINGFSYYTSTEDIELGLRLNQAGYRGAFVPKVLVEGYAPPDFKAYSTQQYRWANGNLAILREAWLKLLAAPQSLRYQMHMFFTLGWWLVGIVTLLYLIVPILSLYLGTSTHHTWLPGAMLGFLFANVLMGISLIYVSLHNRLDSDPVRFSDAFLQYSLITNSIFIYSRAAVNALFKRYIGFVRTNKQKSFSGIRPIMLNLGVGVICLGSSLYALYYVLSAQNVEDIRTYVPIMIWLFFYGMIFLSSLLFIDFKKRGAA